MNRLQLGDWTLDVPCGRLEGAGRTRRLEPRQLAVLVRLVEAGGEPVSKDELLRDVWDDVAVVDHVVAKTISGLRRVLGESARRPVVIETVGRGGYRIACGVSEAESAVRAAPPARAERTERGRGIWRLAAAAVLGALAVIPLTSGSSTAPPAEPLATEYKWRVVTSAPEPAVVKIAIRTE